MCFFEPQDGYSVRGMRLANRMKCKGYVPCKSGVHVCHSLTPSRLHVNLPVLVSAYESLLLLETARGLEPVFMR